MKTDAEIKLGLHCCAHPMNCQKCPYNPKDTSIACRDLMERDALALINRLEEEIMLYKIQLRGDCGVCKHAGVHIGKEPCETCVLKEDHPAWEYVGLPEVKKK